MAAVYVSNLIINTGSTFSQTLTLESGADDSAFNLTGYNRMRSVFLKLKNHNQERIPCIVEN